MASGSFDVSPAPRAPARAAPAARNRPDNTAFTQQRLPAWQPLLSAGTVLPLFLGLGAAFLALGLGLHFSSRHIQELELDYTGAPGSPCAACAASPRAPPAPCSCALRFQVPRALRAPVCLYYQLSGYYQNNRRYSISRDDSQLSGVPWALRHPADDCQPYQHLDGTPIAPCGSVANSLFNDSFTLHRLLADGTRVPVPLDQRGISWWTDTNLKFRNPQPVDGSLARAFHGTAKPPNWPVPAYELDPTDPNNTGFVNENFVVWMRTAALPTFRKLYARIRQQQGNSSVGLPRGNYSLSITYNYPVHSFHGTKKVIFSTLSWMGGKNPFLGIAYLVLGSACILTGILMLVVHFKYREQNEADQ